MTQFIARTLRELLYTCIIIHVQLLSFHNTFPTGTDFDLATCIYTLCRAAHTQDDSVCVQGGELDSGFDAEPSVGTSNDDVLAGEAFGWVRHSRPLLSDER